MTDWGVQGGAAPVRAGIARAAAGIAVLIGLVLLLSGFDAGHQAAGIALLVVGAVVAAAAEVRRITRPGRAAHDEAETLAEVPAEVPVA